MLLVMISTPQSCQRCLLGSARIRPEFPKYCEADKFASQRTLLPAPRPMVRKPTRRIGAAAAGSRRCAAHSCRASVAHLHDDCGGAAGEVVASINSRFAGSVVFCGVDATKRND